MARALVVQHTPGEGLGNLLEWLPDHVTEDLSIPSMAARAHLSERQFSRLFKTEVGTTPADYVEALRLEAACRLLETTMTPVDQIARTSGFGTPETMIRVFRRRLDTTPTDHRHHFGPV